MAHILVVEDEQPISDLITMNLKLVGHTYAKAYNGLEAADMLEQERADLILLDVMLPGLDGFAVMQRIAHLQIPVILITAKHALADRIKGFELGAEDYIIKPFEMLELLARINVVLRRNEQAVPAFVCDGVIVQNAIE